MLFEVGDRIRHSKRPEWGVGTVLRAEHTAVRGEQAQRLTVRFGNGGTRTLSTLGAELEVADATASTNGARGHTLLDREAVQESGWLGEISPKRPEDAMVELSPEVVDPFRTLEQRLRSTANLFRFNSGGAGLIDWAVAQSGLDDPLSRFTRHELEEYFKRWSRALQSHLASLLSEARREGVRSDQILKDAPQRARETVNRINEA